MIAFCHGLFGQGKNWTQIAKAFAADHRALLIDMPNHGRSEWTEVFDYGDLADRVASLFTPDDPVTLVGHSMGGKIAMAVALRHPELVERLVVVDVSPVAYESAREFLGYIDTMRGARPGHPGAARRGRRRPCGRRCPTPRCAASCCRTSAARATAGPGCSTSTCCPRTCPSWPAGRPSLRRRVVRRAGAVGGRSELDVRRRRARARDGAPLPARAPRDDQGRRALGALRAARRCSSRC